MIPKPSHNRPITTGDRRAGAGPTPSLHEIMMRMQHWDTPFLYKVLRENKNPHWKTAAQLVIDERIAEIPKDGSQK